MVGKLASKSSGPNFSLARELCCVLRQDTLLEKPNRLQGGDL